MSDEHKDSSLSYDSTFQHFVIDNHMLFGHFHKDDTLSTPPVNWSWSEPCMMGIDEAGRGPVLGPMVYGSCIAPVSKLADVKSLKFKDSKVLSERERDDLFEQIRSSEFISWVVDPIHPQDISNKMLRMPKENLNTISHNTAINFVRLYLAKGYNIQELYVDTVGSPDVYQKMLKSIFPQIGTIIVASKADAKYPIVSAASICAKVIRDQQIHNWTFKEVERGATVSSETGSGYPGDEVTKKWLRDHMDPVFGLPDLARFSWSTTVEVMKTRCHPVLWGDEADEGETGKKARISNFFTKTKDEATTSDDLTQRSAIHKKNHMLITTKLSLNATK